MKNRLKMEHFYVTFLRKKKILIFKNFFLKKVFENLKQDFKKKFLKNDKIFLRKNVP